MKRTRIIDIASLLFTVTSTLALYFDQRMLAAILGLIGYFLWVFNVKRNAAIWRIFITLMAAFVFGYSLCPKGGYFCLAASMFFLGLVASARLVFFRQIKYTGLRWMETIFFAIALVYYVIGNIYDGQGWTGWAFPAPSLGFAAFMVYGGVLDKKIMMESQGAYCAEVGKPAPGFSLPDEEGRMVTLDEFKGKRHVLLIFVRGDWCPTCHIMLRTYEKNKEKFAEKNIMLLAIGPDDVGVNKEMVEKLSLDYKLLSDSQLTAARAYGMHIHENNAMTKYAEGIPLPASFLVGMKGNILYTSNPKEIGQILNPDNIFPVIEKLEGVAVV